MERAPKANAPPGQASAAATVREASPSAYADDRGPRGADLRGLRDLASWGPAAILQRRRLRASFGDAAQFRDDPGPAVQTVRAARLAQRPIVHGAGVVQAKWFFAESEHTVLDPQAFNWARDTLLADLRAAVEGLNNEADQQAALQALQAAYGQSHFAPANHVLALDNRRLYLDTNGAHAELLGTLADDQDDAMYLRVPAAQGDANDLYINRATRETYVKDTNNLYTPRFQSRSITHGDRTELSRRDDISPEAPGGNRTPLEHVGGVDSQYLSLTAGTQDVTNAQGRLFNEPPPPTRQNPNPQPNGRVQVDLLNVARGNIVDLQSSQGAGLELRAHMAQNIRDNWTAIWAAAQAEVRGIQNGTRTHQQASAAKPATMLPGQTQQWQQILDAIRTKEVLIAGGIPFDATVDFGESGTNALAQHTTNVIGNQRAASNLRTQAAETALDQDNAALPNPPGLAQEVVARKAHLQTSLDGRMNLDPIRLAGKRQRREARVALTAAYAPAAAELDTLATEHQVRVKTGLLTPGAVVAAYQTAANLLIAARVAGAV